MICVNGFRPKGPLRLLLPVFLGVACLPFFASMASAGLVRTDSWGGGLVDPGFVVQSVAYDSQGRAYIGESGKARVIRLAADGSVDLNWSVGQLPGEDEKKANPVDIAIDDEDNVYVLDQIEQMVRKYTADGSLLDQWSAAVPCCLDVEGITVEAGSVFVISGYDVYRYTPSGVLLDSWRGFDSYPEWEQPQIRGDGEGHLLIGSGRFLDEFKANKSIYKFEPDGTMISQWTTPAQGWVYYSQDEWGIYENLADIDGFDAVVPMPDGNPWTAAGGRIARYGSTGEFGDFLDFDRKRFPNALALAPDGGLLYSWAEIPNYPEVSGSGVAKLDPDLDTTRVWNESDFPKYASDTWDGKFGHALGLTVRTDGVVGGYDTNMDRAQLFDSDGTFIKRIEGPQPGIDSDETPEFLLPEAGGAEFFDPGSGRLSRYDADGDLVDTITLETTGNFEDIALDPEGGYIVLTTVTDRVGQVTFFDQQGEQTSGFKSVRSLASYNGSSLHVEPGAGGIYVQGTGYVEKYSRAGKRLATGVVRGKGCDSAYNYDGLATDLAGNVYLVSEGSQAPMVIKFNRSLKRLWEEKVPKVRWYTGFSGDLDIGPDGSIFMESDKGIMRYDQSKASARPTHEACPKPFHLLRIARTPGRRWAIAAVHVPSSGLLTVSGRKVRTAKRRVGDYGDYGLAIRPKARFTRAARPGFRRFPVTITYKGRHSGKIHTAVKLRVGR